MSEKDNSKKLKDSECDKSKSSFDEDFENIYKNAPVTAKIGMIASKPIMKIISKLTEKK